MAGAPEPGSTDLTVVTINAHGRAPGWSARRQLLLDELVALRPDVVSLQELRTFPSQGHGIARSLNRRLSPDVGSFRALTARKRGWRRYESIGLVTRLSVASSEVITLGGGGRVALRARLLTADGEDLDFYATHFEHGRAEHARVEAARRMLERIADRTVPAIIAGDLNSGPNSATMEPLLGSLHSAYSTMHGSEPDRTVPTDPARPGAVLDYILVTPDISVLSASVAFQARDSRGRTASDHFGLAARVAVSRPVDHRTSR